MVGDRWRDTEAGSNAGCKTIFIDYGYAEKQPASVHFRVSSLTEATQIILENTL
jgi:D-glycero-D-manno-heptose 1,7-bisphosphate phosphatase